MPTPTPNPVLKPNDPYRPDGELPGDVTLRDLFAAFALGQMRDAHMDDLADPAFAERRARAAYSMADEMLKARCS